MKNNEPGLVTELFAAMVGVLMIIGIPIMALLFLIVL